MSDKHFQCNKCGLCCKSVGTSSIYADLDRGDGTCRFFQDETNLCSIYYNRPLRCNIEGYYEKYLKDIMTKEEFFQLNYAACNNLKNKMR